MKIFAALDVSDKTTHVCVVDGDGCVDYEVQHVPRKLSGLRGKRYEPGMISGPASSSSIVAGVTWVEHALLGTAATAVAIICVAGLGYAFLAGRVPLRRAVTVLIGCFILFGAPTIAAGLSALVTREPPSALMEREPAAPQFAVTQQTSSRTAPDPFNPYAGE